MKNNYTNNKHALKDLQMYISDAKKSDPLYDEVSDLLERVKSLEESVYHLYCPALSDSQRESIEKNGFYS